jgi:hypothetical protein
MMTWAINLFIDGETSLDALSKELNALLDIKLKEGGRDADPPPDGNEYTDSLYHFFLILVDNHGLINDRDMNFEDFRYELSVLEKRRMPNEISRRKCLEFSKMAFDILKRTGKYRIMLTENVQSRVEYFDPSNRGR